MTIKEQYEKETGKKVFIQKIEGTHCVLSDTVSKDYVEWLETKLNNIQKEKQS